jgi:hypothetical protein
LPRRSFPGGEDPIGQLLKINKGLLDVLHPSGDRGQFVPLNIQWVHDRVADQVVDDQFEGGNVTVADIGDGDVGAEKIIDEHFEHDAFDFGLDGQLERAGLAGESGAEVAETLTNGVAEGVGEFVESFGLKE